MKKYAIYILATLIMFSCESNSSEQFAEPSEIRNKRAGAEMYSDGIALNNEAMHSAPEADNSGNQTLPEKDQKIIKDGHIQIEVRDIYEAKEHIDSTLTRFDAYYENESYHASEYQSNFSLRIRVPSQHFESFVTVIETSDAKLLSKNIMARDVTEEFIDLEIRLENSLNYLERYQQLLSKANNIKDILEIQEKIRQLESEIESRKGRLKYLNDQVGFSTINLTITQKHPRNVEPNKNFGHELVNSFKKGINGFLNFTLTLVRFWPFIILIILLWIFRSKINLRFWKKKP